MAEAMVQEAQSLGQRGRGVAKLNGGRQRGMARLNGQRGRGLAKGAQKRQQLRFQAEMRQRDQHH